ncbi:HEPN domain-containing protein [Clostridium sp. VAP41]|uniref:HEPN domain-containing protein n=1 Tax=Clostridium sp. VAP41 TaxID=2949979 RepID=UPI002079EA79|nr:HEPN domain-containing protein [Clostridium sp. VAP41]
MNTIKGLVDNYMNIYYVKDESFNDINAMKLLQKILHRMFSKRLEITIAVPILLLDFEVDEYQFNDKIKIRRMTDEEQLSRYDIGSYDSTSELFIVEEALYVLELGSYTIENNNFVGVSSILYRHDAYPVQEIDEWFAALRVVTGFETGYTQILAIPNEWYDMEKADLLPMKGAKVYKFNYNLVKHGKWNNDINKVSKEQLHVIKRVFDYMNEKVQKSVKIAINRLNRCFLREDIDDATIDAVIAIEALLTENDLGEITYKVSNRASAVISTVCKGKYSAVEIRDAMKRIYAYRSKVVHGSDMKEKDINIKVNERITKNATDLAIEFLRYIILAITENNELAKANKIDEYMCEKFDSSKS